MFVLDTTTPWTQNRANILGARAFRSVFLREGRARTGGSLQYMPGWTVQCINPDCAARGHWLRADVTPTDRCSNCDAPLRNVPPPLGPRLRMRPRSLGGYRPQGRPR